MSSTFLTSVKSATTASVCCAGVYGVDKQTCARMAYEGLMEFVHRLQSEPQHARHLRHVYFVNIDRETTDTMGNVMKSLCEKKHMFRSRPAEKPEKTVQSDRHTADLMYDGCVGAADGLPRQSRDYPQLSEAVATGTMSRCVICLEQIVNPRQLACGHIFCEDCIAEYFEKGQPKCPSCGRLFGVMKGNQPPGTFTYCTNDRLKLSGYERHRTLEITYRIPDGIQTVSNVICIA